MISPPLWEFQLNFIQVFDIYLFILFIFLQGGIYRLSSNILQKTFCPITCHNLSDAAIAAILFV